MTRQEIAIEVAKNHEFFQEQCRAFALHVEGYAQRLIDRCKQRRAELKNEYGENVFAILNEKANCWRTLAYFLDSYEELAGEPPEAGWVWDKDDECCRYLNWDLVRPIWCPHYRPADDKNPLLWFIAADKRLSDGYVPFGGNVPEGDRLLHDAVLLAIAHDCDATMSGADPRVFAGVRSVTYWSREAFFKAVNTALERDGGDTRLEKAWHRVEAELDRRTGAGKPQDGKASGDMSGVGNRVPWMDESPDGWIRSSEAVSLAHELVWTGNRPDLSDPGGLARAIEGIADCLDSCTKNPANPDLEGYLNWDREICEAVFLVLDDVIGWLPYHNVSATVIDDWKRQGNTIRKATIPPPKQGQCTEALRREWRDYGEVAMVLVRAVQDMRGKLRKVAAILRDAGKAGGAGTANSKRKPKVARLTTSRLLAYQSFRYALATNQALVRAKLKEVYRWLESAENRQDEKHPYKGAKMPKEDTWKKYLRDACREYDSSVERTREAIDKEWSYAEKHGRNVVSVNEIVYRSSQQAD